MCTRRLHLRDPFDLVGAEALSLLVGLCQTESLGSLRAAAFIGRKRPIFGSFQHADTENFGQGLQSVLWQQTLRAQHPRIVAGPLQKLQTLAGREVV